MSSSPRAAIGATTASRREDAADRRVAAGEALAADQEVGHDVPVIDRELARRCGRSRDITSSAMSEHAVAAADLGDARPVAVGRDERARGRAADRLGDEGGDASRAPRAG